MKKKVLNVKSDLKYLVCGQDLIRINRVTNDVHKCACGKDDSNDNHWVLIK